MLQSNYFKAAIFGGVTLIMATSALAAGSDAFEKAKTALNAKKYEEAASGFSEAFKGGEYDAAFFLGRMLELGLGGPPDLKAAIGLYLAGSTKGSGPAKNRLGVLHIQGRGVLQDFAEGAKLICEAAETGDVNGQFNCGSLLQQGRGVAKNDAKAVKWFKAAAAQGHLAAKNQYANALIEGKFIERDVKQAVRLFQQTAATGNPVGMYSLAQAFAGGLGVDKDLIQAHAFFNIAAALEHPKAAEARQIVEQQLKPEQIIRAQQLAKAWRPTPPKAVTKAGPEDTKTPSDKGENVKPGAKEKVKE